MKSVPLTLTQTFSYYLLPLLLTSFGVIPLYFWIAGKTNHYFTSKTAILLALSFLFLTLIVFLRQKRSLNFYSISSDLDIKTKNKIVKEILLEHRWTFTKNNQKFVQAEGNGFRNNFDLRSWSELLTIEVNKSEIKINSICNPDGWIAQAFSFGKNKQNTRDFEMIFLQRINEN